MELCRLVQPATPFVIPERECWSITSPATPGMDIWGPEILGAVLAGVLSFAVALYVLVRTLRHERDQAASQADESRSQFADQQQGEREMFAEQQRLAREQFEAQVAEQRRLAQWQLQTAAYAEYSSVLLELGRAPEPVAGQQLVLDLVQYSAKWSMYLAKEDMEFAILVGRAQDVVRKLYEDSAHRYPGTAGLDNLRRKQYFDRQGGGAIANALLFEGSSWHRASEDKDRQRAIRAIEVSLPKDSV
ncbi:hypothetical protein ACFWE5_07220 [Cellulosimicrobium funkei]|uniref:hypothetical protein n=1 Tax=Cellulosimicrobium funkei TaxID=264251 RepID=UPI00364814B5